MGIKIIIETNVNDCRDCPFKYDNVGHGECKTGQVEKRRENSMYNGTKDETYLSDDYGYAPVIEEVVTKEVEVYRQKVEELDLVSVIQAINSIKAVITPFQGVTPTANSIKNIPEFMVVGLDDHVLTDLEWSDIIGDNIEVMGKKREPVSKYKISDVRIFHEPYSAEALTLLEKNVENLTDGSR